MKKQIQKIKLFFKNLFFQQQLKQIQDLTDIVDQITKYKGYDLNKSLLDQQVRTEQLQKLVSDFVGDVIQQFIKRFSINQKSKYNYLMFIPSIKVINYINDCFQHVFYSKKYKKLFYLSIIAKNELFSITLTLINKWIYGTEEQQNQNEQEDDDDLEERQV